MSAKIVARIGGTEGIEKYLDKAGAFIRAPLVTEDDIIKYARDADAVVVGATEPYTRRVIEALEKCRIISRGGIGCDNIDLQAATDQGIPVAYVPDASVEEVSDHSMALVLALSRRLLPIDRAVKAGAWRPGQNAIIKIRGAIPRLSEQTLGLAGLGRIGNALCLKARVFGMKVIVYDPYLPASVVEKLGAKPVDFDTLLTQSDYISLHTPLTEETRRFFSLPQMQKMKPTAFLINAARGGLIDEEALVTALTKGYLAGAGLDVTEPEPPKPDNPLLKMENVIVTAHTAFYSQGSVVELSRRTAEAVITALKGIWPSPLANPEVKQRNNRRIQ